MLVRGRQADNQRLQICSGMSEHACESLLLSALVDGASSLTILLSIAGQTSLSDTFQGCDSLKDKLHDLRWPRAVLHTLRHAATSCESDRPQPREWSAVRYIYLIKMCSHAAVLLQAGFSALSVPADSAVQKGSVTLLQVLEL